MMSAGERRRNTQSISDLMKCLNNILIDYPLLQLTVTFLRYTERESEMKHRLPLIADTFSTNRLPATV